MLRAYQAHPTNWSHVIEEVKENIDRLPQTPKELYSVSSNKQIRDRLSSMFGKLLSEKRIEDDDIRREVEAISRIEKRLVQTTGSQSATTSTCQPDMREATLAAFSDSDTDHDSAGRNTGQVETLPTLPHARPESQASVSTSREEVRSTQTPQQRRNARKRPLIDTVRENQLHCNRIITKKVPQLLRQLGVSSNESD